MELKDAIKLIDGLGKSIAPEIWADLGCGSGLFTYALANLLPSESLIYAVDKSPISLDNQPNPNKITIQKKQLDFVNESLDFAKLDGVLMANSLHFVRDKVSFLNKLQQSVKVTGRLLIVEYDTDTPNPWVPYPTSFKTLKSLLEKLGYTTIRKLGERPSLYQKGSIYAVIVTV
ncbi:class I SAM-dependent methyltransferase [Runella sp.]|uniref:class I SAM-dependent methyltransferase n=1 Tax=Runella sp. TaxID=1960881 RepID=UPI003D13F302